MLQIHHVKVTFGNTFAGGSQWGGRSANKSGGHLQVIAIFTRIRAYARAHAHTYTHRAKPQSVSSPAAAAQDKPLREAYSEYRVERGKERKAGKSNLIK